MTGKRQETIASLEMTRRTFMGIVASSALSFTTSGYLAACKSTDPEEKSLATEQDFMKKGKGEHLVCAKTGKLIKVAPAILAEQLGYFKEEDCDVEFQYIALADAMASMSVNRLDIDLFGVIPACSYVSQGVPIYVFGGTILNGSEIIGLNSFTQQLKKTEDFKGLSIGCGREESGQIYLKNYLLKQGLKVDSGDGSYSNSEKPDVTFVYIDNMTAALEGLRKGEQDLYICNNAMGYTYSTGYDDIKVVAIPADITGNYPCCRQNCSEKAYTTKFLSLVDFEIALIRGYAYYKDEKNKADVIQRMAEYSAQGADYVEAALYGLSTYRNVMDLSPDPHTKEVISYYNAMEHIGAIDKNSGYSMAKYATPFVYKKALDTLLKREPDNHWYKQLADDYRKYN